MNPTTMHCLSMLLKEVGYELPCWTTSWGCVDAVRMGTLLRCGWGHDDRRSHKELEIVDIEDVDNQASCHFCKRASRELDSTLSETKI